MLNSVKQKGIKFSLEEGIKFEIITKSPTICTIYNEGPERE
jgi:hypothetical protein